MVRGITRRLLEAILSIFAERERGSDACVASGG
jgi:hypothetical protein